MGERIGIGHQTRQDFNTGPSIQRRTVAVLGRQELERVGKQIAAERGLAYAPSKAGEHVSGRPGGVANLGCFAMIKGGLGFQLVPWQPVLEGASTTTSVS